MTPDSFSDGGRFLSADDALFQIEALISDGADLIDIGAVSTRPGSEPVSLDEEISRLRPVLQRVRGNFDVPFSVDTARSEVAELAGEFGAAYVNDVSAMCGDQRMGEVIAAAGMGVILMHMQGEPETMQTDPKYVDVVSEVKRFLSKRVCRARQLGISEIVVDPGIGFGKTVAHNLALLRGLDQLLEFEVSVLVGVSNKSFIGEIAGAEVGNRLAGSLAAGFLSVEKGVSILRVHDVGAHRQFFDVMMSLG